MHFSWKVNKRFTFSVKNSLYMLNDIYVHEDLNQPRSLGTRLDLNLRADSRLIKLC